MILMALHCKVRLLLVHDAQMFKLALLDGEFAEVLLQVRAKLVKRLLVGCAFEVVHVLRANKLQRFE